MEDKRFVLYCLFRLLRTMVLLYSIDQVRMGEIVVCAHVAVIFFPLPHGTTGNSVVSGLHPFLSKGGIMTDCSNEKWENTQPRQWKRECIISGMG